MISHHQFLLPVPVPVPVLYLIYRVHSYSHIIISPHFGKITGGGRKEKGERRLRFKFKLLDSFLCVFRRIDTRSIDGVRIEKGEGSMYVLSWCVFLFLFLFLLFG